MTRLRAEEGEGREQRMMQKSRELVRVLYPREFAPVNSMQWHKAIAFRRQAFVLIFRWISTPTFCRIFATFTLARAEH
jgi:hypothetical protein